MIADRSLIMAQGKLAAFVATLLQRHKIIECEEFGRLLTCFASIVGETQPEEADILMLWADMILQASKSV